MHLQPRLVPALVLALTLPVGESLASSSPAAPAPTPATQVAGPASGDSGRCTLRAADFDKLTPHRWKLAQYRADQRFPFDGSIRIDLCELVGIDAKGLMREGVMVYIGTGANAGPLAKHLHAACSGSLMPEARGKVQPVPGVPGGHQCVTANGRASVYWIESAGRTVHMEPLTEGLAWTEILPRVMAAAAR